MVEQLSNEVIQEMKKHALQVISTYGNRDTLLFDRYREMYFMEDETKRPYNSKVDEKDWAITVSPSSRNEVVGMVRLLDTSELHITVREGDKEARNADKIEKALKTILRVSGEFKRARMESDAALSSVLYGPVILYFESVADILAVTKNPYQKRVLERLMKRTPVLIRTINPEQSYPEFGEYGLLSHTWKYKVKGGVLKERWGIADAKLDQEYQVYDIYDCENRLVYADGISQPLFSGAHGLTNIPIVVRYSGGSSLFVEPEKQINSFLYAKAKSKLDKRENALLTAVATAINVRGMLGPLLAIDPDNSPDTITVDYQGGIRYIRAKAQQVDDKVIDPVVFQWKNLLDEISGQSTVYRQTLGQDIQAGTFSGLSMLSNAGKLPMVDMQRGIEMAFRDIFLDILYRIKDEGIENNLISAMDIPDECDIDVSMEAKLPQDQLRNAQVAQSIGSLVSDKWKHSNLLQISDSNEMEKEVAKEQIRKALLENIVKNPQIMEQFVMMAMGQGQQPQGQVPPEAQAQSGQVPPDMQGGQQISPEMMAQLQGQMQGQGGMPTTGMEGMPQTDSMIPPQERR